MNDNHNKEIIGSALNVLLVLLELAEEQSNDIYPETHAHILLALESVYCLLSAPDTDAPNAYTV